jgi:ATP-binding cassette subfamily B protein
VSATQIFPAGGQGDRSGLTGPADIPEPPRRPGTPGVRARLRRLVRHTHATLAGLPRVLALEWAAGPGLTVGLALATVVAGLVPAATASLARLLINAVLAAVRIHATHQADRVHLSLPLPGVTVHLPAMSSLTGIAVLIAAQFLIFTTSTAVGAVTTICSQLLQDKTEFDIQRRVMTHAATLDLSYFEDSATYDTLRQIQREAAVRPVTMLSSVFGILQTGVTFLSLVGLLATLSPLLALIALLAPVPAFIADSRFGFKGFMISKLSSPTRRRMQYLGDLVSTDTYAKEVKLFGLAPFFIKRFGMLAAAYYRRQRRLITSRGLAGAAWTTLSTVAGSLMYAYVALAVVGGRLTLGDLALYTTAAAALQTAIQALFQGFTSMYENNLYLEMLYQFLATPPVIEAPAIGTGARRQPLPARLRGHVVFDRVSFTYPGAATPALRDISFEMSPGTTTAVVGRNGAGKSTLVKLMCRLYDPDAGRILLDGTDIREFDPAGLRAIIGALFQDHVAYQATAGENVGLGEVAFIEDLPRIQAAAAKAGSAALIEGLRSGYGTPLGKWFDQGVNLSGGEWQKIAIARAFMRDPALLILDEPSSALDARAEHELFLRLKQLASCRTALYISHRFSTVRQADRIVLLDGGRLAEEGTHEELMMLGGAYADLFTLQAQAYADAPAAAGR